MVDYCLLEQLANKGRRKMIDFQEKHYEFIADILKEIKKYQEDGQKNADKALEYEHDQIQEFLENNHDDAVNEVNEEDYIFHLSFQSSNICSATSLIVSFEKTISLFSNTSFMALLIACSFVIPCSVKQNPKCSSTSINKSLYCPITAPFQMDKYQNHCW